MPLNYTSRTVATLTLLQTLLLGGCAYSGAQPMGLNNDKLPPCPESPNCVCSEAGEHVTATIEPLRFGGDAETAWQHLVESVIEIGGQIQENKPPYLRASFTSSVFRFVDDMEFRLDTGQQLIHLRSASRVGYSDFGVNKRRAVKLQQQFSDAWN